MPADSLSDLDLLVISDCERSADLSEKIDEDLTQEACQQGCHLARGISPRGSFSAKDEGGGADPVCAADQIESFTFNEP